MRTFVFECWGQWRPDFNSATVLWLWYSSHHGSIATGLRLSMAILLMWRSPPVEPSDNIKCLNLLATSYICSMREKPMIRRPFSTCRVWVNLMGDHDQWERSNARRRCRPMADSRIFCWEVHHFDDNANKARFCSCLWLQTHPSNPAQFFDNPHKSEPLISMANHLVL